MKLKHKKLADIIPKQKLALFTNLNIMIETIIKSDISKDIYHIFKKKEDLPIKK
jgi:hypothetical protein